MIGFLLSRYGLMFMAVVIGLVSFQGWKIHYGSVKKEEGRKEVVQKSVEQGKKANDEGAKKRARISTDDKYFDSVRKQYYRD